MLPEAIRQKLRWVEVSDPAAVRLERFPHFLIVGPQRTGTTWLHAHLRFHPQVFLSEPKELFYFSSLKVAERPRFPSRELAEYLRFFRDPPWRFALKTGICLWRHRQFYRPLVRGEATASYAALDADVIEEIALLRPDIKVVLMVRNPVERAWSHAKKDLVRNRGRRFEEVTAAEFVDFFTSDYQRRCARFVEQHDQWAARLRPGHLFVGRFDDIALRPHELLLEVMSFLGVRSDRRYLAADVAQPVNPTGASRVPAEHRRFLAELLAADLEQLRRRFGLSWDEPADAGRTRS